MKRKKGFYSISVVAKMFGVHQQTIRLYEKEGLIAPKRSTGNTRLFSEEDVDRLEEVIFLTHKMGVNLAGVEMILRLQKKITKLQNEVNNLFKATTETLESESTMLKEDARSQAQRLLSMKQQSGKALSKESGPIDVSADTHTRSHRHTQSDQKDKKESVAGEWEIEYDDEG